jgi:hypothetical protein
MTLRLNGSTSGYTEIDAPAVAGSNTLVLPTGNGTADQVIATNGSGALSFADRGRMVLETAKAWNWNTLTTNAVIDFTGIPSWVKKITVMLNGVSTSGTSNLQIQLGDSGGIENTNYSSGSAATGGGTITPTGVVTTGMVLFNNTGSTATIQGLVTFVNINANDWVQSHNAIDPARCLFGAGSKTLSATLDRVRITTVNGTDTFDAGSINILYEG